MIGLSANFRVNLNLFCDHEITNEDEILEIKSQIKHLNDGIAELIYNTYARTDLDGVQVDLEAIDYLEPQDLEEMIEVYELE